MVAVADGDAQPQKGEEKNQEINHALTRYGIEAKDSNINEETQSNSSSNTAAAPALLLLSLHSQQAAAHAPSGVDDLRPPFWPFQIPLVAKNTEKPIPMQFAHL